ncbi:uncharacterized protein LOC111371506 [Olea europaea var. sylvestris]|uniref:uncharacterized protein LOC111371506 n=1 Tax=Olea europaea var. sylvestris TaxID=158386 RepID=UPI000C1D07D2|nr:uncharacterized protein LOC111371506 [Olea europaea var. sylvestris]
MNALSEHFSQNKQRFKFYVVVKGKNPGIFHSWIEVLDCIKNFPDPLYKGFTNFQEALDAARQHIGINFYLSHSLKNYSDPPLDFSPNKDQNIFCQHCECMQRNYKVINEANQNFSLERTQLQKKVAQLEKEILDLKVQYPTGTMEPKKSIASPGQTVAGKDLSNPLKIVELPKAQQTQGTVDSSTKSDNQTKQTDNSATEKGKEIWDLLGQPSGKFDYLIKYSPPEHFS